MRYLRVIWDLADDADGNVQHIALENGQRANFTLDTVRKYAQAVGKRVLVTIADTTAPVATAH